MRALVLAALLGTLAGCARSYEPIIDSEGVDPARYQQDLEACRGYAEQVSVGGEAAAGTGIGAVFGTALGAIAGAFGGGAGEGAAIGAGLGGVTGAAQGTASGVHGQQQVVANCLRHRGYAVLR
jgi:hypothetical protein